MAQKFFFALALFLSSSLFSTGNWSLKDYYEYSALEKRNFLWEKILKSSYKDGLPVLANKVLSALNQWNSNPDTKLVTVGSVAKIQLVPMSRYFSGIFSSGALGLVYLSLSAPYGVVSETLIIKFLIDDSLSLNLKISHVKDPQVNIKFSDEFVAQGKPEPGFFWQQSENQVVELAKRSCNGRLAFDLNAPSQLIFVPSKELTGLQNKAGDFRQALAELKSGILYEVYTLDSFNLRWHIANIMLDSEFINSHYADTQLFMQ